MQKVDTENLSFKVVNELIDSVIQGYKTSSEIYFFNISSKLFLQLKEALLFLLYSLIAGMLFIGAVGYLILSLVTLSFDNFNVVESGRKPILSAVIIVLCLILYGVNKISQKKVRIKIKKENDIALQKSETAKIKIFNTLQRVTKNPISKIYEIFFSKRDNTDHFSLKTLGMIIKPKLTILNLAILSLAAYFLFKNLFKTSTGNNNDSTPQSQLSQTLGSQIKSTISDLVLATIITYYKEFLSPSPFPYYFQRSVNKKSSV